jgi:hypothetical protein
MDRGFATVGDYVSDLVQNDAAIESPFQTRKTEVEAALLAGLASSPATPLERADWNELRRRVMEVHIKKAAS